MRAIVDSLCDEIKDYLEIKVLEQKASFDFREAYPSSAEAYRYFIEGVNLILDSDYKSAINTLKKAVEIDTAFTFASFYIAFAYNFGGLDSADIQTSYWIRKAYNTKKRLPLKYQNWLSAWNACSGKDPKEINRYLGLLEKAETESRLFWLDVGVTYSQILGMYDKAEEAFKKVEDISVERDNDWKYEKYYDEYSKVLLLLNKPGDVLRICDKGLKVDPENAWLMVYKGSSYVMLGDSTGVNNSISEIKSFIKKNKYSESTESYALGTMYLSAKDTTMAEKYYRKAYMLDPENRNRKANLAGVLIRGDINIEEGLKLCEEVLVKYPDLTFWIHMKGLALHKLGRNQEALEILKELDKRTLGYYREVSEEIMSVEKALAEQENM